MAPQTTSSADVFLLETRHSRTMACLWGKFFWFITIPTVLGINLAVIDWRNFWVAGSC